MSQNHFRVQGQLGEGHIRFCFESGRVQLFQKVTSHLYLEVNALKTVSRQVLWCSGKPCIIGVIDSRDGFYQPYRGYSKKEEEEEEEIPYQGGITLAELKKLYPGEIQAIHGLLISLGELAQKCQDQQQFDSYRALYFSK